MPPIKLEKAICRILEELGFFWCELCMDWVIKEWRFLDDEGKHINCKK